MNIKGKSKDNLNARKDIGIICNRSEIAVDLDRPGFMAKAVYTLDKFQKRKIFEWIKHLKFSDGYTSNLSRCVDLNGLKMHGIKSHDCHVFMERLIPIAFREMLPEFVWSALIEVSLLFQSISSATLDVNKIKELKESVAIIICNLEKIFPPAFFDSMEHLIVHLPYEARVGSPVQYRWMYPFERFLHSLKKKVKNKAAMEASICEAYIVEKISTFATHYFEPDVCKRRRPRRNDDGLNNESVKHIFIFKHPGRPYGA
ncbi:UNVERIFIED_CONTAM: hypothetical protein Slati_0098600 [Sesamum latifolium]|uniref:DUF4218 domain-containing protein n=1 Tax=Sesamum latifolium TaxID=2727402 RepID=A0AAW2Y8M9_9LAMI